MVYKEKIKELEKIFKDMSKELIDLNDTIEHEKGNLYYLESEADGLRDAIHELEKEIEYLKRLDFAEENDELAGDEFVDSFILASKFTRRSFDFNRVVDFVQIKEDELFAFDGYKAIIIKCSLIPEELKNSFIRWYVRDDFENNISRDEKLKTAAFNCEEFLKTMFFGRESDMLTMKDLYDCVAEKRVWGGELDLNVFKIKDIEIAVRGKYLSLADEAFLDNSFEFFYPKDSTDPFLMKSDKYAMVICPVRLPVIK